MEPLRPIPAPVLTLLDAAVSGKLLCGESIQDDYSHDEMPLYGSYRPDALVFPQSTAEVAAVMRVCSEANIPVTPRGAGTGLAGGAAPVRGGVVLSLERMNAAPVLDEAKLSVRVQAGVLLKDIQSVCAQKGLFYPPDPGEKNATIGGNAATNAGGMRALTYGSTRSYIRAMTVVLPDGRILQLGADTKKNSTGYNLLQLIVGSEGTLGIITELTLALLPQPGNAVWLIAPFATDADCFAAALKLLHTAPQPETLEYAEAGILRSAEKRLGQSIVDSSAAACLMVGYRECGCVLSPFLAKTGETLLSMGATDVLLADAPQSAARLQTLRDGFLDALRAEAVWIDEADVAMPLDKTGELLSLARRLGRDRALSVRAFGHIGDGNLHIYLCGDGERADFLARTQSVMQALYAEAAKRGGLVSGEHGVGFIKRPSFLAHTDPTALEFMRAVKAVFDPGGILNPGKIISKE